MILHREFGLARGQNLHAPIRTGHSHNHSNPARTGLAGSEVDSCSILVVQLAVLTCPAVDKISRAKKALRNVSCGRDALSRFGRGRLDADSQKILINAHRQSHRQGGLGFGRPSTLKNSRYGHGLKLVRGHSRLQGLGRFDRTSGSGQPRDLEGTLVYLLLQCIILDAQLHGHGRVQDEKHLLPSQRRSLLNLSL